MNGVWAVAIPICTPVRHGSASQCSRCGQGVSGVDLLCAHKRSAEDAMGAIAGVFCRERVIIRVMTS